MAKQVTIGVNELKNLLMEYTHKAFTESFDKGSRKYGDRWKTTGWNSVKALADSKWDMFVNILDAGSEEEIDHHASDMIAWITILAGRSVWGIKQEVKHITVVFSASDFVDIDEDYMHSKIHDVIEALQAGKRVVIE